MSGQPTVVSRRDFLHGASAISLGLLMEGCASMQPGLNGGVSTDVANGLAAAGNPDCIVTPSAVEGPFYVDVNMIRSNIVESQAGAPLSLTLKVVRADSCEPIPNAVVDIWHANANGQYSAEASEGTANETYLRGVQTTDANGEVRFDTIYPGWYAGRTTHIHGKIFLDSSEVTTQFYFPDDLSDTVYANNSPYSSRGERTTRNANDQILADENEGVAVFLDVTDNGDGTYGGKLTIGIA